jgi:hypothetical protein
MAYTLKESLNPGVDFEGTTNNPFTITIDPLPGSSLRMASATYGALTLSGSKLEFKVIAGKNLLHIAYAAAQNGESGWLAELGTANELSHLRRIRSTGDFNREYILEGV